MVKARKATGGKSRLEETDVDLQDVLRLIGISVRKPRKRRKGPEARVLSECLEWLHATGVFCWRNNTGGTKVNGRFMRFGMPGSPDIIGIVNGSFLAIECKAPGEGLNENQEKWHAQAAKAGCRPLIVRSLDELKEAMGRD